MPTHGVVRRPAWTSCRVALEGVVAEFPQSSEGASALTLADTLRVEAARAAAKGPTTALAPLARLAEAAPRRCSKVIPALDALSLEERALDDLRSTLGHLKACGEAAAGVHAKLVIAEDDASYAAACKPACTKPSLRAFTLAHPKGKNYAAARTEMMRLDYAAALALGGNASVLALGTYLKEYPDAPNAKQAGEERANRRRDIVLQSTTWDDYYTFVEQYSTYPSHVNKVRAELAKRLVAAKKEESSSTYEKFLERFPKAPEALTVKMTLAEVKAREAREEAIAKAKAAAEEAAANAKIQGCMNECMSMIVSCDSGTTFSACNPLFFQCCHPAKNDCRYYCGAK